MFWLKAGNTENSYSWELGEKRRLAEMKGEYMLFTEITITFLFWSKIPSAAISYKMQIFINISRIKSHSPPFGDVQNMARMMSGIWPVKTVHIPDIKNRCPGYGQFLLALFGTSKIDVWDKVKTGHVLDITYTFSPYYRHHYIPEKGQ